MKHVAKVMAFISPCVMDMANIVSNMTRSLLEVAMEFDKLVSSILALMLERNQLFGDLLSMENKLKEVQSKCKKLKCDLEESSKKEKRVGVQHHSKIRLLEKKVTVVEHHKDPLFEGDMPVTEESLATLDKLFLPHDGMWKGKNKVIHLGEGSHGPYIGNVDEVACSQFQSKPQTGKDVEASVQGKRLEIIL
jgi:hypothetical protein